MGTRFPSKYNGQCPECEEKYVKDDLVYYDGDNLNRMGKKLCCKDYKCFKMQGGHLDKISAKSNPLEDLTYEDPKFINKDIKRILMEEIVPIVDTFYHVADLQVERIMPKLDKSTNTFGMIRNAYVTHMKDIWMVKNGS